MIFGCGGGRALLGVMGGWIWIFSLDGMPSSSIDDDSFVWVLRLHLPSVVCSYSIVFLHMKNPTMEI